MPSRRVCGAQGMLRPKHCILCVHRLRKVHQSHGARLQLLPSDVALFFATTSATSAAPIPAATASHSPTIHATCASGVHPSRNERALSGPSAPSNVWRRVGLRCGTLPARRCRGGAAVLHAQRNDGRVLHLPPLQFDAVRLRLRAARGVVALFSTPPAAASAATTSEPAAISPTLFTAAATAAANPSFHTAIDATRATGVVVARFREQVPGPAQCDYSRRCLGI